MQNDYKFFHYISDDFDKDNFRFILKLSNYISHSIVDKNLNVKSLNKLDRYKLAEKFLATEKNHFKAHNQSVYNLYFSHTYFKSFLEEIALYIDLKIPYFYYIKKNKISGHDGSKFYKGITSASVTLKYYFSKSTELECLMYCKPRSNLATDKQISYLCYLLKESGYILKDNAPELTNDVANKLIQFILNDKEITPETFNTYLEYE